MYSHAKPARPSRIWNIGLWVLQIITAAAFLATGFATLSGQPMMVETFDKIGVGQWFRYLAGIIEIVSAILLLFPRLAPVGAALLVCTMSGAVLAHLLILGGSALPALVLGCFAGLILWGRFATLKSWLCKRPAPALAAAAKGITRATSDARKDSPERITSSAKEGARIKAGDVFENPVTGERAVVRIGTDQNDGELLVADLSIKPGGAVMGEHLHPALEERFTVLGGRVGFRLAGRTSFAEPGAVVVASPGMLHNWWNAGDEVALVRVEVRPGARFAAFIVNAFGLAQDGRVNRRGMPKLLQRSLFAREFDDVIQFTRPSRGVQRILFGALAPVALLLGYRGSYPEYSTRRSGVVEVEPIIPDAAPLEAYSAPTAQAYGAATTPF